MTSGELDCHLQQKSGKIGKTWHDVIVDLHEAKLSIKEGKKSKGKTFDFVLSEQTRVKYQENAKKPSIVIEDEKLNKPIVLTAKDNGSLIKWVIALRGATFYNPQISMDSFEIISVLGRGFFGKVMLVQRKDNHELFAIKTVHKVRLIQSNKVQTILAERSILEKVKHPFIVGLKFAFQSSTKFYLGLEYVPGGEIYALMGRKGKLDVSQVRIYVAELALAIDHLHHLGIVYRDLKPENILIAADGRIKLTDFGLSKDISASMMTKTFCGTADFMAPEIVNQQMYGMPADWWALGILMYSMLFGTTPFHNENRSVLFRNIMYAEPKFPPDADHDAVGVINGLLIKQPGMRMTLKEMKKHVFFKDMDFDLVLEKKYTPEFIPEIEDPRKPKYFDAEFTGEAAIDSIATPPLMQEQDVFYGFSFIDPRK